MKANYETRSRTFLTRRTPVIIRLDGKAFHTYTKGLDKPFDEGLIEDMAETARFLCSEIQGAKLAYVQSDEISILLTDYDKLGTDAWFDYNVQKITSISASLATAKFNELRMRRHFAKKMGDTQFDYDMFLDYNWDDDKKEFKDCPTLAFFDSRAFNIPKEEVSNYFLARQKDAVKNSVAMLAQSLYSHKELDKKNQSDMQEMCFQKGQNWNDLHWSKKRGSTIVKNEYWNDELVRVDKDVKVGATRENAKFTPSIVYHGDGYYGENTLNGDQIEEDSIKKRTKWDIVETPMTFDVRYFESLV